MEPTDEMIREVMSHLGKSKSDRKHAAVLKNIAKSPANKPGRVVSEETKARMKAGQAQRRANEKEKTP